MEIETLYEREHKVKKYRCQFCKKKAEGLIYASFFHGKPIKICSKCYEIIDKKRFQLYSKVMDKVALLECGYYVNRKCARW